MLDVDAPVGRTEMTARQRYLEPGMALSISDLTDTLGGYVCHVVSVDERMLWIDLPLRRDGMLSLSVGQLVTARFDRPGDAVYLFDSVVAERRDDDVAPFGLALPATVNRRPRRSSARLALVLDATIDGPALDGAALDGSGSDDPEAPGAEVIETTAKVVDVSASGLGVVTDRTLAVGDEVHVRCTLPGRNGDVTLDEITSVAVVSFYGRTPGGSALHHYGVRFRDLQGGTRDEILDAIIWNLTAHGDAG